MSHALTTPGNGVSSCILHAMPVCWLHVATSARKLTMASKLRRSEAEPAPALSALQS